MKIQTQFRLLITGILAVPVLVILAFVAVSWRYRTWERQEFSTHAEIAALIGEDLDFRDREALTRFIVRSRTMGKIAIFRHDFFVLYSEIPEFNTGDDSSPEAVMAVLASENRHYGFSFDSPRWIQDGGFVMVRRDRPGPEAARGPEPWFYPALLFVIMFFFPAAFAIVMSFIIVRSITRSVMVLEDATRRIAGGELDLNVEAKGSNEITSLANSLNKMRSDLKEEELRRARFIMGISHDLKTPLALIRGYAEAIEDGVAADSTSRGNAAEIIIGKSDQLEGMINDLIDFVRMDAGEWRGRLENVGIAEFLRGFMNLVSMDVELLHHEIRTEIALDDSIAVPMDSRLFVRALENLVGNALRHTPPGTVIRLDAFPGQAPAADGKPGGPAVVLRISDTGPGIAEEDLPHIFELFYRVSPSRRENGMGLGLAVVKWIVDFHGWSITVESGRPAGAVFTVVIPLP